MKWTRQQLGEISPSIGVALLIAGYIRYTIQGELLHSRKILLIAGGVLFWRRLPSASTSIRRLFLEALLSAWHEHHDFDARRRRDPGGRQLSRHQYHKRFDLTTEKLYTLSDQTKKIVQGLKKDVTIVRFGKTPDQASTI